MVGASSNIYVSATRGYTPDNKGKDEHGYRRTQHTWLVSVEPRKQSTLFPRRKAEPIHYFATREDGDESYQVQTHNEHGIIGTILVKEGAHGDVQQLQQALQVGLKSASTGTSCESSPDAESDRWLRKALHVLQTHDFTDKFDVGEFMTFAHGYIADRLDRDAPARIAYPGLHKHPEEKKWKKGFWLSYPTRTPNSNSGDPESRHYGGLM